MNNFKKLLSLCLVLALLLAPGFPVNLAETVQTPSDLPPVVTDEPVPTEAPSETPSDVP